MFVIRVNYAQTAIFFHESTLADNPWTWVSCEKCEDVRNGYLVKIICLRPNTSVTHVGHMRKERTVYLFVPRDSLWTRFFCDKKVH